MPLFGANMVALRMLAVTIFLTKASSPTARKLASTHGNVRLHKGGIFVLFISHSHDDEAIYSVLKIALDNDIWGQSKNTIKIMEVVS